MPEISNANETVADLLARDPRAGRVLLNHGMHCAGCAIAPFETLAEACLIYRVPLERLLADLRREAGQEGEL